MLRSKICDKTFSYYMRVRCYDGSDMCEPTTENKDFAMDEIFILRKASICAFISSTF